MAHAAVSEYELARARQIKANQDKMALLGLGATALAGGPGGKRARKRKAPATAAAAAVSVRQSSRLKAIDAGGAAAAPTGGVAPEQRPLATPRNLDEALAQLRKKTKTRGSAAGKQDKTALLRAVTSLGPLPLCEEDLGGEAEVSPRLHPPVHTL